MTYFILLLGIFFNILMLLETLLFLAEKHSTSIKEELEGFLDMMSTTDKFIFAWVLLLPYLFGIATILTWIYIKNKPDA